MVLRKLSQVLVDVKDNRNRDDECNREKVSPYKLFDDIPVYSLYIPERVQKLQKLQSPACPADHAL